MTAQHGYANRWKQAVPTPSGFANQARAFLRHATISTLSKIPSQTHGNFLRCLYCHYVFADQQLQFEKIIKSLQVRGTFVDTNTCTKMVEGTIPIDGRFFHLSFDDGFRNVFQNALPILRELGVPAIVFVPTTFIDAEYESVKRYCLRGYAGIVEMLHWDELRTLVSWGYDVGSHTRTHARFSELSKDGDMLEYEIYGSKSDIETQLQRECKYISWPYGTKGDADSASLDMTRQAGYSACFGAFRGSVIQKQTSVYSIPRHHFEVQWPLAHIEYFASGHMEG